MPSRTAVSAGTRFGRWVALDSIRRSRTWFVSCRCDCGVTKEVIQQNLRKGTSTSCGCLKGEAARIRNRAARKYPADVSAECAHCGKSFLAKWRARDMRHERCCSISCGSKVRDFSREKNPNWRNNATERNHGGRVTAAYQRWRRAVLDRDGNKCSWCGSTERLHVDHIVPYAHSKSARLDVDNGQVLCCECHKLTPTYGAATRDAKVKARKRDKAEALIVRELRARGFLVIHLDEPCDLVVTHKKWGKNVWKFLECKSRKLKSGEVVLDKRQQKQADFCEEYGVPYVTDGFEALLALGEKVSL